VKKVTDTEDDCLERRLLGKLVAKIIGYEVIWLVIMAVVRKAFPNGYCCKGKWLLCKMVAKESCC